jgi:hypothetical protein
MVATKTNRCDAPLLPMCLVGGAGIVCTRCKVNVLSALFTDVFPVEFIGEYFYCRATILTFTEKRLEVPECFKTGAMAAWSIHHVLLLR